MDTLFAPNDAAIEALREYLLGGTVDESTDDDASATESATESDLSTEKKKVPTALEMLGAGNATTATAFLAYHVLPDRRVSLGELVDGSPSAGWTRQARFSAATRPRVRPEKPYGRVQPADGDREKG